jgi:inorganic pyrophosphatase
MLTSTAVNLDRVTTGNDVPDEINVVIEIPMNSDPIKYELDKRTGAMFVDRFVSTSMHYPCNYGYIPHTLADDGDPVDVLVVTPFPVMPGVVVRCRPVGMLEVTDEEGIDTKLLAVPIEKLSPLYRNVKSPQDFAPLVLDQIQHFFAHYKDLEPGKWVRVEGWKDADAAKGEIRLSVERYGRADPRPVY